MNIRYLSRLIAMQYRRLELDSWRDHSGQGPCLVATIHHWSALNQTKGTITSCFHLGPKSPGLIILEHELSDLSVQAFINAYPLIKSNNWTFASLAGLFNGGDSYENAHNSSSNVTYAAGILPGPSLTISSSLPSQSSSSSRSVSIILFAISFISTSNRPQTLSSVTKLPSYTASAVKSSSSRQMPKNFVYAILAIALMTTFTSLVA